MSKEKGGAWGGDGSTRRRGIRRIPIIPGDDVNHAVGSVDAEALKEELQRIKEWGKGGTRGRR